MLTRKAMFLGLFGVALAAFSLQPVRAGAQHAAPRSDAASSHAQDASRQPGHTAAATRGTGFIAQAVYRQP